MILKGGVRRLAQRLAYTGRVSSPPAHLVPEATFGPDAESTRSEPQADLEAGQ